MVKPRKGVEAMTKHDTTIERLKHWLDLAEGDRALGDDAAISAKLLVIRAEIENALNLRRKPASAIEPTSASIFKLQFKYAAAMLLFIAAVVVSIWVVFSNGGGKQMTAKLSEPPKTVVGSEGSEDSRATRLANLPDASFESADEAELVTEVRSPGGKRESGAGRRHNAGGRESTSNSIVAAADDEESGTAASPAVADSADATSGVSTGIAQPSTDTGAVVAVQTPAAGSTAQGESERPKLDPLSLIAALDAHFDSVE
jgi:hypothetical protein